MTEKMRCVAGEAGVGGKTQRGRQDSAGSAASNDPCEPEFARCTCLDRARIALEQTGQHHCAGVMKDLQHVINVIADDFYLDANKPVEIVNWLAESLVELQEAIKPVLDLDNYNDDSNGQYWFKQAMLDLQVGAEMFDPYNRKRIRELENA